ncbi:MAG: PadR family transcriptional regulator [Actinobacteria bacterium]|nr:PadR family transcriptional regulator [Actinomycetota bacterium]
MLLGLLTHGPKSGYELKQVVDRSTRYFWAASYGQIYPELKRLEAAGLVKGEDAPTGGRPRRIFRITDAGREALTVWLRGTETRMEFRDESLLRLLFADSLPREEALGLLQGRAEGFRRALAELRAIDARPGDDPPFVDLALRYGIDWCEWVVEWCELQERRLRRRAA